MNLLVNESLDDKGVAKLISFEADLRKQRFQPNDTFVTTFKFNDFNKLQFNFTITRTPENDHIIKLVLFREDVHEDALLHNALVEVELFRWPEFEPGPISFWKNHGTIVRFGGHPFVLSGRKRCDELYHGNGRVPIEMKIYTIYHPKNSLYKGVYGSLNFPNGLRPRQHRDCRAQPWNTNNKPSPLNQPRPTRTPVPITSQETSNRKSSDSNKSKDPNPSDKITKSQFRNRFKLVCETRKTDTIVYLFKLGSIRKLTEVGHDIYESDPINFQSDNIKILFHYKFIKPNKQRYQFQLISKNIVNFNKIKITLIQNRKEMGSEERQIPLRLDGLFKQQVFNFDILDQIMVSVELTAKRKFVELIASTPKSKIESTSELTKSAPPSVPSKRSTVVGPKAKKIKIEESSTDDEDECLIVAEVDAESKRKNCELIELDMDSPGEERPLKNGKGEKSAIKEQVKYFEKKLVKQEKCNELSQKSTAEMLSQVNSQANCEVDVHLSNATEQITQKESRECLSPKETSIKIKRENSESENSADDDITVNAVAKITNVNIKKEKPDNDTDRPANHTIAPIHLTINVKGHLIDFPKDLLMAKSKWFERTLHQGLQELIEKEASVEAMEAFLQYIKTDTIDFPALTSVYPIHLLAVKYEVRGLVKLANDYLRRFENNE